MERRSWLTQSGDAFPRRIVDDVCAARQRAPNIVNVDCSGPCAVAMSRGRSGLYGLRVLVEQCGELLRREDPVALGHELTDLLPVRVVGEQHADAITAGS